MAEMSGLPTGFTFSAPNLSLLQVANPLAFDSSYVPSISVSTNADSVTPNQNQERAFKDFAEPVFGLGGATGLGVPSDTYALKLNKEGIENIPTEVQNDINGVLTLVRSSPSAAAPQTVYNIDPNSLNVPSVRYSDTSEPPKNMTKLDSLGSPYDNYSVPNILKKYPGIPLFFEMIDSTNTQKAIRVDNVFTVQTLKLTPNPENMTINSAKKINRFNSLNGWIEEHWGDEIDTVSFNGSTFSFFGIDHGLTYQFRNQTNSYQFIRTLIHLYQLNGCIYQNADDYEGTNTVAVSEFLLNNPEFVGNHPRKGMIKERLYIRMTYDYLTLLGRFETFDIIEDATKPFRLTYNIIFKAEKTMYTLDMVEGQNLTKPMEIVQNTNLINAGTLNQEISQEPVV